MEKKRYVETTPELTAKGMKQVCYLHMSEVPHPVRFEMWCPRGEGGQAHSPYKPGFYEVDAHDVYVRQNVRPGTKGGQFVSNELSLGGLRFVSAVNPLTAPLPASSVGPARKLA
jgi:hypothetical protein